LPASPIGSVVGVTSIPSMSLSVTVTPTLADAAPGAVSEMLVLPSAASASSVPLIVITCAVA
jgi:hypothetical protein